MRYEDTWQHCPSCQSSLPAGSRSCPGCGRDTPLVAASGARSATARAEPPQASSNARVALPPMRLARGTRISVYRIESAVGEGGMGVVYQAWDEALGRPVALKCLHANLSGDSEICRRFAREARVLSDYRHDNVVRVFDFIE